MSRGVLVTATARAEKTFFPTRFIKKWQMKVNFPGVEFLGTAPKLEKRKKIRRGLFSSSKQISRFGREGQLKMYQ